MRRSFCVLALVMLASASAFAAKRVSLQELTQMLTTFHDSQKSDEYVADQLKQLELSEEMSSADRDSLGQLLPGTISLEQLEILRGRSVFNPPPASRVSSTPAPDAGTQKTILDNAGKWITGAFLRSPAFTATKATLRYQDDAGKVADHPGLLVDMPNTYTQLYESHKDTVAITQGAEKIVESEDAKTKWGMNGQVSEGGPVPPLPEMFQEATATGKIAFARWDTSFDKPVAVFSFSVDKKKTRYTVLYCCFPDTETATHVASESDVMVPNQVQSVSTWEPFKKTVPYHGFFYIEPTTGAILRTLTFAELKPGDTVRTEDVRNDYTTGDLDGKTCILPERSITVNEVVPGADTGTHSFFVRHGLLMSIYSNYHSGTP
jgi:hypothetical protein